MPRLSLTLSLWPHKDFVRTCIQNKRAMRDFRAVKRLMRWIGTGHDPRSLVRISFASWVCSSSGRRIFFLRFYFADLLRFDWVASSPSRSGTLRAKRRAEHKKPKHCY
jgi:hypothetical protein